MPNSDLFEYVTEYGCIGFDKRPFSYEDASALCQIAYLKFDSILEPLSEVTVSLYDISLKEKCEELFSDPKYEKPNRQLFDAMVASERFKDTKLCFYVNRVDTETQFAAVTYILSNGLVVITFRGTDENIVGWQEDMKLWLNKPIEGQKLSIKYINDVSNRISGSFYLAGHSKGGNLALYSAILSTEAVKERISEIICFDSPGFRNSFLIENDYDSLKSKVVKFIPRSSVIGLLLDDGEESIVVDSKNPGIYQHNLYSWVIKDGHFSKNELKESHKLFYKRFNDWVMSMDENKLEKFVDFSNRALDSAEVTTTREFSKDFIKSMTKMVKAASELDDNDKKFLTDFMKSYIKVMGEIILEEVKEKTSKFIS